MTTNNRFTLYLTTVVALLLFPLAAFAQPKVTITIKAEKEITVTAGGKQIKKKIEATKSLPGEVIIYTLSYNNSGTEAARDVVISDPIPEGTSYVPGSASEAGDLTFSIDHGKTFKKPTQLSYEVKNKSGKMEKRVATAEEYTDVRWTIATVPAGGKGSVSFKVKVK
jgi:uncharacterized repeat protein (TIGR01451 family)